MPVAVSSRLPGERGLAPRLSALRWLAGMASHELATNAAKYGAFSTRMGSVHIAWRIDADGIEVEIALPLQQVLASAA